MVQTLQGGFAPTRQQERSARTLIVREQIMDKPYCGEVEKRVEAKLTKIEATLEKHGDALADIHTDLAVIINRGHPPCKEYDVRIKQLEDTKTSVSSGGKVLWKVVAISGGVILGLCSIGALIVAVVSLWK